MTDLVIAFCWVLALVGGIAIGFVLGYWYCMWEFDLGLGRDRREIDRGEEGVGS